MQYEDEDDDLGILRAARAGDVAAVRGFVLRDPAAVRQADDIGRTSLHYAAPSGSAAALQRLLELRAAVAPKDEDWLGALGKLGKKNGEFDVELE
eukprot:Skav215889  [mRNA]  locus=scaffold956:175487:177514:- [translate_table: standard]